MINTFTWKAFNKIISTVNYSRDEDFSIYWTCQGEGAKLALNQNPAEIIDSGEKSYHARL